MKNLTYASGGSLMYFIDGLNGSVHVDGEGIFEVVIDGHTKHKSKTFSSAVKFISRYIEKEP